MSSPDSRQHPGLPDLDAIRRAAERIAPHAHETPVFTSSTLDRMCGARLFFKAESLQRGGAFKFRGAANAVLSLTDDEAARGVLTHSSGNHGAALALAAAVRGIPARVVMPEDAPRVKRAAVAGYGAEITFCAPTNEARREAAARLAEETGALVIHPYDDERVIAGQGTAALEIHRQVPELDYLVVPVGGGGLASGCAIATAGVSPATRVVGAEPARADDAARSLTAGRHLTNPPGPVDTVADGLKASLAPRTYRALAEHLERVVTVPEEDILPTLRLVWERMKLIIEPSCAVPVAALLAGTAIPHLVAGAPGAAGARPRVGVILSGGNVDLDALDWSSVPAWPEARPGGRRRRDRRVSSASSSTRRWWIRRLGSWGTGLAVACILVYLMFEPMLRSMIYPAPPVPVPEPPPGLTEVTLESADGTTLVAWAGPGEAPAPGRPAVLLFHGNGENLATMERSGLFARLGELDVPYLAVDYPGYGRSGGEPGEESLVAGAEAALARLREMHPDRPLVVLGWSLGAAVAMQLAARDGAADGAASDRPLAGLILLSPWSRLADTAAAHFPAPLVRPLLGGRYDSVAAAPATTAPALLIHGARDRIIPVEQGRELAEAMKARPEGEARWVEVPGAGHNDLLAHGEPWREMEAFLDRLSGQPAG